MSDEPGGEDTSSGTSATTEPTTPRSVTTAAGTVAFRSGSQDGAPAPDAADGAPASVAAGNGSTTSMTAAERRRAKRIAYWSRPKPPKDWRYWVGGTGRVLIVLGLLMFAFVAYQLWGTGIEQARAQNQLENELEEQQAALGTVPVFVTAPTTTPPPTTPPPTTPGATTAPTTEPPPTEPPTLSLPPIAEGEAIGVLRIDRVGMTQRVVAGVGVSDLKKAPGHFPQTPMPGELGNAAIAGHRTTHGAPFLHLDELEPGDEIVWENLYKQQFVYRVTGSEIVSPSQGQVINTLDNSKATLTLVTCDPAYTSTNRLIIYAELVAERSPAPTAGQEYYGQEGDDITVLPGDDAPAETTAATDDTAVDDTSPGTTTATAEDDGPPAGFSDTDPFAQGWFSDSAAWPQIIAWGAALIALVGACYALARAVKRRWVGWVVAAAPFTVLLYFFFQNVNRLLPPGL